jgi:hypothetical protein
MKNVDKIASDILKTSDAMTKTKIKMLWDKYKEDISTFSTKLNETLKNNHLSFSTDRGWISKFLKSITGDDWKLTNHDFKFARVANVVDDLGRLLKLQADEKFIQKSMQVINILDSIEKKTDLITKNELVDVKEKLRKVSSEVQDIWETLFALQQRLINEGE